MKMNKLAAFSAAIISMGVAIVSQPALAAVLGQAGDIEVGNPYDLNEDTGVASYYKTGTSGTIRFTCSLDGEKVIGMLTPGKNFNGNPIAFLDVGNNGPFEWKLSDKGEEVGNVKVHLLKGTSAVVQCKTVA